MIKILSLVRKISGIERIKQQIGKASYDLYALHLKEHILNDSTKGVTDKNYFPYDIIISLTSYGRRIDSVAITIESLMQQTLKANRIVLWIDEKEKDRELPTSLMNQISRGLEVKYCRDIRSYTKLIYSLKAYPKDAVITVDDDIIYPYDLVERFIKEHRQHPNLILCSKQHLMKVDKKKRLAPYKKWEKGSRTNEVSILNFPTGVGGVLYPSGSLDIEVFNESVFLNICPTADDIWFKAMALRKGTLSKRINTLSPNGGDYIENPYVQDFGLFHENVGKNRNDEQLHAVFSKYDLYRHLVG